MRLAAALGLTAVVLWQSDPRGIARVTADAQLGFIGAAVLLVLVDRALMAYRWLVLLRPIPVAARPPFPVLLRLFFVSTFVGTFLPASVGADAVRAYGLRHHQVSGAVAVASVLMDRLLGVLSILVMAVVGLVFVRQFATNPSVIWPLALAAAVSIVACAVIFSDRVAAVAARVMNAVPGSRAREIAGRVLAAVTAYHAHHIDLANVLLGSIGVQVLRIVQAYLLGRALGIEAGLGTYFALIPIVLLVMLLPITINGIGTSQAAFVWFFGAAGVSAPHAFALSILFVALGIVGNLPGGVLYVLSGINAGPPGAVTTSRP
ncbi:MAG: flippase-like domain-containing protein [Acidobacteria bacterium]|nr:flippase-like domain-containing protein [Acidobacteriota bacterium]